MDIKQLQRKRIRVYGGEYRGKCPPESAEQKTVINAVRKVCTNVVHPRNEGKRTSNQIKLEKAEGLTTGASDIIVPGSPAFVCELKRKDPTKSEITDKQIEFLLESKRLGAWVCIAFGHEAALEAFNAWYKRHHTKT